MKIVMTDAAITRFWAKVERRGVNECWLWHGATLGGGYGCFWTGITKTSAHRISYALAHGGAIADGMFICHRCDNPPCVNPAHLFAGTHRDNTEDMLSKGRCPVGSAAHHAKLSDHLVASMRLRYAAGGITLAALATESGVSPRAVSFALSGETWKHVEAPIIIKRKKQEAPCS